MPNHQTTIIVTTPNVAAGFMRESTEEERKHPFNSVPDRVVDFALVVPPPERMYEEGCDGKHPHPHPDGGFYDACWYEWNHQNWGTKWNAYDQHYEVLNGDLVRIQFDTAWACPFPVLYALSEKFPDDVLSIETADEDLGGGVAIFKLKGGEEFDVTQPEEYSEEAKDIASRIKYGKTYADLRAEWGEDDDDEPDETKEA